MLSKKSKVQRNTCAMIVYVGDFKPKLHIPAHCFSKDMKIQMDRKSLTSGNGGKIMGFHGGPGTQRVFVISCFLKLKSK